VNPVREIARICRAHGVPLLVDGAQACRTSASTSRRLGCDFYVFAGHKVFGRRRRSLWARGLARAMPPFLTGAR
jgi:cysteine desulfurase/selenocysteine lyase